MPTWTVFQACHPIMHQKDSLLIFLFSSTSMLDAIIPLVPRLKMLHSVAVPA